MRRADRLFQIIQILRSARKPITARQLAQELETSVRTIYRDIAELMAQRVPIQGEAGIGYVLKRGYDMPPLMLTADEIEAAVLGAQWVAAQGDPALARAARDLVRKIHDVVPEHLRPLVIDAGVTIVGKRQILPDALDMQAVRCAIRDQRKIHLRYGDHKDQTTERTIWPIAVAYFERARLIVAWCQLRQGFRHFRTDRIQSAQFLDERFDQSITKLRAKWWEGEQRKRCFNPRDPNVQKGASHLLD